MSPDHLHPTRRHPALRGVAAGLLTAPLLALAGTATATPPALTAQVPLASGLTTARLIVKYVDTSTPAAASHRTALHLGAQDAAARAGLRLRPLRQGALGTHVLTLDQPVPLAEMTRLAQDLMATDPAVAYAEPDRLWTPQFTPNDTRYGQQWQYFESTAGLNLPAAWDHATGRGVVVAVVDTGVLAHADLKDNLLAGHDFVSATDIANDGDGRDADASDPGDAVPAGYCGTNAADVPSSWHGTHVAGTIGAVTHNGQGVAGVAHGARVLPVRVMGRCGGYTSDIADGIVWAAGGMVDGVPANAHPARVINLSLGGVGPCDRTSQAAIDSARERGAVVVAASGNGNDNAANFTPANCSGVLVVTATDRRGDRAYYANLGSIVALAAPGGDVRGSAADGILSTSNDGLKSPGADTYGMLQGTSMAAPHVAGVVALMLSRNPTLTPDDVRTRLRASARSFPGACPLCGAGLVDAGAAVDAAAVGAPPVEAAPVAEVEPNFMRALAQPVQAGTRVDGHIAHWFDIDLYKVALASGTSVLTRLVPNDTSDYDLYLYDAWGHLVTGSELGKGQVDSVTVRNDTAGPATYYLVVSHFAGTTGRIAGAYRFSVD